MRSLAASVVLLLALSIPVDAAVTIDGATITETPALYRSHIRFLTVPPDKHGHADFNSPDIARIKALEDAVRREIFDRMISAGAAETFSFANLDAAKQHWLMRITIIDTMKKMNDGTIRFGYFDPRDPARNVHVGSARWQLGNPRRIYFRAKAGETSHRALADLLANTTRGECFGAITACFLFGAATALGEAAFDALHPAGTLELGPSAAYQKHRSDPPLPAGRVRIPGDYIYMKNKDDYLEKCRARNYAGFWQGENFVYIGGDKFSGLGVDAKTEAEAREALKRAYVGDTRTEFEGDANTLIRFTVHRRPIVKP